jgi:PAS domain-containing protein
LEPENGGKKKKYEAPTITKVLPGHWQFPMRKDPQPVSPGLATETVTSGESEDDCRIVLSVDGKFVKVSEGFCRMLGYEAEELLRWPIDTVTASETVNIPQHLGVVMYFAQFQSLWMFVHKKGGAVLVRNSWEVLPDWSIGIVCQRVLAGG